MVTTRRGKKAACVGEATAAVAEVWTFNKVQNVSAIRLKSPIRCMESGCNLVAGSSWISNKQPHNPWYCCIDHQELHFNGWPPIDDLLPLKTLTDTHRDLLVAKCSSSNAPAMPVFPNDLSTNDATGLSIRARSPGNSVQSPLQRKKARRGSFAGALREMLSPRRRKARSPLSNKDNSKKSDKQDKVVVVKLFKSTEILEGIKNIHEEDECNEINSSTRAAGSNPSPANHNISHTDGASDNSISDSSSDVLVTHVKAAPPAPANRNHSNSSDDDNDDDDNDDDDSNGEEPALSNLKRGPSLDMEREEGRNYDFVNDLFADDTSTEEATPASNHSTSSALTWSRHNQRKGSENEEDGYESPGLYPERKRHLVKDTPHNPPTPDIANSTPSLFRARTSREEMPTLAGDVVSLDSSSSEDEEEVPQLHSARRQIIVELECGKLGFSIGMTTDSSIVICDVKEKSPNHSLVLKGDFILAIGEFTCVGKTVEEVATEFSRTRQKKPRFVQVRRLVNVRGPPPSFRRNQNRRGDEGRSQSQPPGGGRSQNRPNGVGRGGGGGRGRGRRGRGDSASIYLRSLTHADDTRTFREDGKKANDKKKDTGKQQQMGKPPRRFGDLHGKGVVKKMKTVAAHYYDLGKMVTPAPILPNGDRTKGWKKLHGIYFWIDPFKSANANGGPRGDYASAVLDKTRIVVHGYSREHIEDGFAVLKQIVAADFAEEGDTYQMAFAMDLESATSAYKESAVVSKDKDDSGSNDGAAPNDGEIDGSEALEVAHTFHFDGHTPGNRKPR